ncbi:hypothetical protein LTR04_005425, partial [Oleoguttula sp. CCFEE 6159]
NLRRLSLSAKTYEIAAITQATSTPGYYGHARTLKGTPTRALPLSCPGCGAASQNIAPNEAGYYTITRGGVKSYLKDDTTGIEEDIFDTSLRNANEDVLRTLGLQDASATAGVSIYHPSIESIEDTIAESPHKYNHIYHVLDAADFPMSLIPNLQRKLSLSPLRSQNRRAKSHKFVRGRTAEVSFIITRSDLLAPQKEQVDRLMPYLTQVLRDALGSSGENVRLGNVRCVSSKRGWWTKEVKEAIWERGGAGWMVGKVNVGKSNLFEVVFPKGRNHDVNIDRLRSAAGRTDARDTTLTANVIETPEVSLSQDSDFDVSPISSLSVGSDVDTNHKLRRLVSQPQDNVPLEESLEEDDVGVLLPPAQTETAYPVMPIVSSLPGTTASPLRIPFGGGKGELIDLPGVARSNLEKYVRPEHRQDLVMRSRVTPEQHTIKPGQSLLLGGLIRITPTTPDLVFLAFPFVPLDPHVTSTEKAIGIQTGERNTSLPVIAELSAGTKIASAGIFQLKWDVTKQRAGPLTSPSAVKLKADRLPFVVYSADVLIEGVGWVEIVAQKRRSKQVPSEAQREVSTYSPVGSADEGVGNTGASDDLASAASTKESEFPTLEIFSPKGQFVAIRRPMNAWLLGGKKHVPESKQKQRPRQSMRSVKARRH